VAEVTRRASGKAPAEEPIGSRLLAEATIVRRLLAARLRGQLQYRASFLSQMAGNGLIGFAEFASILVFFSHIDRLGGWTVGEIAILYGIATISFGLGHFLASGLASFPEMVVRGEFDQMLTRPVSPFAQVLGADIQIRRLGTVLQGAIALVIGFAVSGASPEPARLLVVPAIVLLVMALYIALFALEATLSFWTTQGIETVNIATYGGNTIAPYPIDIFADWLKGFFLFVVPLAFAVHIPMAWVLGKPVPLGLPGWVALFSVPAVALFCVAIGSLWRLGVRRYRSTGS
jgi:ABC-2 type transport system permease protein